MQVQVRTWDEREESLDGSITIPAEVSLPQIEAEPCFTLDRLEVILELRSVQEVDRMLTDAI